MARRKQRESDGFSLSFLDCICCGFGAIILLLVLSKIYDPSTIEIDRSQLDSLLQQLEETLFEIRGESAEIQRELVGIRDDNVAAQELLRRLQGDFSDLLGQFEASNQEASISSDSEGSLRSARQRLTEEMRRLQSRLNEQQPEAPIGGIPVDSEYIIFIIDTSGSMQQFSWRLVQRKIDEVLNLYPQVKGVQVMNDNGAYLFGSFARRWMSDSPQLRRSIRTALQSWNAFSDSNPVQGIDAAIRTFWAPDKKISLYVFGDEFTGRSVENVADAVDRINRPDETGRPRVRIHAIGFPLLFNQPGRIQRSTEQFAALMRELCRRNGGTFVALTDRN
ncbi:MAG: VWA domain-containing protein [Pseudomonadota bacterium]